ncbi:unnamed protein product [Caenorhabditis auriculariae]|uniref:Neurotransmitter-gated ion-channel ligand-binding domain-containing protein n=1 Tax=Caenorhabditis auriculariae TaxID=2777116 RepID=A0A8S1H6V7_9PELO|nr:unnamed protein product [Caenorhabditis auriculariae]
MPRNVRSTFVSRYECPRDISDLGNANGTRIGRFGAFLVTTLVASELLRFIAKKQKTKGSIIDESLSRRRELDDDTGGQVVADPDVVGDPHGRLAAWIRSHARHHIPLKHPRTHLDVYVSAGLYQIVDLDQKNNLATVSAYFDVYWLDEFLQWSPEDFGGIERIFVPIKWIWKPEFYMYHSVYGRVPDYAPDASAELSASGRVRMFVAISSKSFCPINFKRFPFDSQTCSFSVMDKRFYKYCES